MFARGVPNRRKNNARGITAVHLILCVDVINIIVTQCLQALMYYLIEGFKKNTEIM